MANQNNLSEQLQLLHECNYSDVNMRNRGPTRTPLRSDNAKGNHENRFLDAIAAALTSGQPGDVVAATFDKRQHIELVLAKNGPPTSEDIGAANEFISLIGSPAVTRAAHLFPFLMRRCGANIDKRIHNLHTTIQSAELRSDFASALQAYVPEADIRVEFPVANLLEEYRDGSFFTVWSNLVETITDLTSQGLNAEDPLSSTSKYATLVLHADTLARSRFFKTLDDSALSNVACKERIERLKRRLRKVCQYFTDIAHVIKKAKRLLPISHHWVEDTFTGTGEGALDLCDSPYDVVARELQIPCLSPEIVDNLHTHFPSILSNWERRQTTYACVHAELRIILHFHVKSPLPDFAPVHPIGVSKRSCLCCTVWMELYNDFFGTQWKTSGSHGKPKADWALTGVALGRGLVDNCVWNAVSRRLEDVLYCLLPRQRSESDDEFEELEQLALDLMMD